MRIINQTVIREQERYDSAFDCGVLSAIGNTPLIKLEKIFPNLSHSLYAKLEFLNPGGSAKDRPALNIIKSAWVKGLINKKTTIIESSSGNFGIGLAQICQALNLSFICVVDKNTTSQNLKILNAYGAKIEMISNQIHDSQLLIERIRRVEELKLTIENSFWCNQYANIDNAQAHRQTMHEIALALKNKIDYLFCATSTCGSLRGYSEYVKSNQLKTKIIAVDALGSVIFGDTPKRRLIPGHGAGRIPELYKKGLETECIHISDLESIHGCRRLLQNESILAGGSSGAIISAFQKKIDSIPSGSTSAIILYDRGERYLETIYSDSWVNAHFTDQILTNQPLI